MDASSGEDPLCVQDIILLDAYLAFLGINSAAFGILYQIFLPPLGQHIIVCNFLYVSSHSYVTYIHVLCTYYLFSTGFAVQ